MSMRWPRRILAGAALTVAVFALTAGPAAAHVTVNPGEATPGGFEALTFRVPTERDDASTVKVEVLFPTEHPLTSVSVKPQPGWSYETETTDVPVEGETTEVVSKITWTADDEADAIGPGEYGEFQVSGGPMPENVDRLVFKAIQYYDGGEVVRWIEEAAPGAEPEHPAPVLKLRPEQPEQQAEPAAAGEPLQPGSPGGLPLALSIVALVVGVAAGVVAGLALRRTNPAGAAGQSDDAAAGRGD